MDSHPHPTRRNILEALRWLVRNNQHGDSLVFYFSGHGLRPPGFFDNELDGFNETICPLDFTTAGMIMDNEINDIIVRPLNEGVKLHVIIDAFRSRTILELPHVFSKKEQCWLDNKAPSGVYKGTNGGHVICISTGEDNLLAADTSTFTASEKQLEGSLTYTLRKVVLENSKVTYANLMYDTSAAKTKHQSFWGRFPRERPQGPILSSSKKINLNEVIVL